ncbi:hypothetical protein [Nonomuraea sp. NPDC050786]
MDTTTLLALIREARQEFPEDIRREAEDRARRRLEARIRAESTEG